MKRRLGPFSLPMIIIIAVCLIINGAAWLSTTFSDFFVAKIFPLLSEPYGRITSLFPFSVGEMILCLLVVYIGIYFVILLLKIALFIYRKMTNTENSFTRTCDRRFLQPVSKALYRAAAYLLTIAAVVMTLNCFVMYHTSKLVVRSDGKYGEYTVDELAQVRDYVVEKCNELSKEVPHDENGNIIYDRNMAQTAKSAMKALGKDNPRLSGFYVTPKALLFSGFMSQQYMQGYYFPFSMEANYNDTMNIMNKPFTMCHELAHTHGYIYEDEANYWGFLACINSEDIVFEYSGYLGILNYINNDFYYAVGKEEYNSHVRITERVRYDNEFLSKEAWKEVEDKAILKTETVKKAADAFIDTNLKVNGVSAGKASYSYVVGLIIDYYYEQSDGCFDKLLAN